MMSNLEGCQLPTIPKLAIGLAEATESSFSGRFKRRLAFPWNRYAKLWLKRAHYISLRWQGGSTAQTSAREFAQEVPLNTGDLVKVRTRSEIDSTLDPFKELKGCAFLPEMYQYCGTQQRVLKSMQRFLDERDYRVKKVRGVILLENVICNGTPAFGACDRCCFFFWREEWLEKVESAQNDS
jgi:hypothetical protein